jgi:glycosyltransferase involved in cell wall biosynthesis
MRLRWTPCLPGKYTETLSHSFLSLVDALSRRYDILHIHSLGSAPVVPVAWLAGRKILFHIHGQEWKGGKWGRRSRAYFKACEPVALDFAHGVIVNTMASRDYYWSAYQKRTTYIPNATDVPVFRETGILEELGLSPRGYILFVGRLVPEKGCHYLVEAHRRLQLDLPVVVVGEPAHTEEYAGRLKESAGPHFRFLGTVLGDRLTELYARSLLVVNPTERDAVSLVLLEAMSQGACVLASDIPEMVEGLSGSGYHFRQRDVDDLCRVLKDLLDVPSRIEVVREKARRRVREVYDWEPVTDQFEDLYRTLLDGTPNRG